VPASLAVDTSFAVSTTAPFATGTTQANFTADSTGYYYVSVRDLVYDETGSYTLSAATVADSYTLANPVTLNVGGSVNASMQSANNTNWFKVALTAGVTYDFTETGLSALGVLLDIVPASLAVDTSFAVSTTAPFAAGTTQANFTADSTGYYYVSVRDLVYDETGSYTLSAATVPDSYTLANPVTLGAAVSNAPFDFTGNSVSDVLWFSPTNDTVGDWLMSNGTPAWQVIGQGSSTVNLVGTGDFNGNGTSDVLWENPTNGVVGDWLMNNNVPTWQQIGQGSTTMNIAGVGDFYGTGTDDILWLNPTNNLVGEWQMNNNTPTWELIAQGSTTMNIVGIGDFIGNGKDDILWENPTNNLVGMWAMNGAQATWSLIDQGSTTMNIVGAGDFTGNGTDDILWENPTNGTVGFWGMNNGQATSWNVVATANAAYQVAGIGDYYGNGTDDILWRNASTGDVGIWAMSDGLATWHDLGISSTAFNTVKA
jgi:hypothetical protein